MSTRPRQLIVVITLLVGLAVAVAVVAGSPPADRLFTTLAPPVQSLMSVTTPFLGVLLVSDLRRDRTLRLVPTLLGAAILAIAVAGYGAVVCAVATAIAPSAAAQNGWQQVGASVVGSVLVQLLAQSIGTGLGLLIRSPVLASLASIVLPLGLWLILGAVNPLRPAQPWLTPFASVQQLTAGQMGLLDWTRWLVVAAIWGAGLNAAGSRRHRRIPD